MGRFAVKKLLAYYQTLLRRGLVIEQRTGYNGLGVHRSERHIPS